MDASLYALIGALVVLLVVAEFAGMVWDLFWQYVQ